MSQIKKGHNFHTIRISKKQIHADIDRVDLLLALDQRTLEEHKQNLSEKGIILYDDKVKIDFEQSENKNLVLIPLSKIEEKLKEKNIHNAVFLGALVKVLGIDYSILRKIIKERFVGKDNLVSKLLLAAKEGHDSVDKNEESFDFGTHQEDSNSEKTINPDFLDGNEAISKGALKVGLTFHVQYPMTPVSGILHYLAKEAVKNKDLTIVQPEDEIAGINFALGASYAGKRAMIATAGGGFALMVESLGLAGVAEIPLVLIEGQRPGPGTGLPTKTEQGDLKFVLSAGVGDFPQVVIAPGTVEECYTETKRAFYLAEKYQTLTIILIDKHLAETVKTFNLNEEENNFTFDYEKRINILNPVDSSKLNSDGLFKRYALDETQRTIPGTENGIYTCAGDEHNEVGEITEDREIRNQMMQRRMNKLNLIKAELPLPKLIGPNDAKLTIVSWGSNYGAIIEAMEKLNSEEKKVNFLPIKYMSPFHESEIKTILEKANQLILIENNYSAQLANLIREKTGIEIKDKILRSDGRTFTTDDVYNQIKEKMNK
jgi:2-oxoglutarate/2-oxoacid ferredoxin oxidoreductase subunit alpha